MHVTCTVMDEDEGTSTCAANFINSYLVNVSVSDLESLLSQQPLSSLTSTQPPAQMCQLGYIPFPPYTISCKTSRLSFLMFVAGFKPFSPSSSPQFLQVHHTCTHVHARIHAHVHAHSSTYTQTLPVYYTCTLAFQILNNEQTHPHSESITSSQLVDSQRSTEPSFSTTKAFPNLPAQRSTEPSKLHFLQQKVY